MIIPLYEYRAKLLSDPSRSARFKELDRLIAIEKAQAGHVGRPKALVYSCYCGRCSKCRARRSYWRRKNQA